jgi:hypothetical protein
MPISRAFLYTSSRVPSKGVPPSRFPPQSAHRERCCVSRALLQLSFKISQWTDSPLIIHLSLEVPGKWSPLHVSHQGPYRERCSISRANGLFIQWYLSETPIKEPSHENGENIRSPSTEPHADRKLTYSGAWPGAPRESFKTLLSLLQCRAAFSMIPSTLAWVDPSPISQHVS